MHSPVNFDDGGLTGMDRPTSQRRVRPTPPSERRMLYRRPCGVDCDQASIPKSDTQEVRILTADTPTRHQSSSFLRVEETASVTPDLHAHSKGTTGVPNRRQPHGQYTRGWKRCSGLATDGRIVSQSRRGGDGCTDRARGARERTRARHWPSPTGRARSATTCSSFPWSRNGRRRLLEPATGWAAHWSSGSAVGACRRALARRWSATATFGLVRSPWLWPRACSADCVSFFLQDTPGDPPRQPGPAFFALLAALAC